MTPILLQQPKMQPFDPARSTGAQPAQPLRADSAPLGLPTGESTHDRIETQVKNWLGQTFFGTLMKQMRDSPFKTDLFSGGRGEQAFGSLYDTQLAQRMAQGLGGRLARPIVRKLEKQAAAAYEKNRAASPLQKEQYRADRRA